jgi:hypothetical protein
VGLIAKMMSTIRDKGGVKLIDRLWGIVNKRLKTNQEWRKFAESGMQQAWVEFVTKVESAEAMDKTGAFKELNDFLTSSPRNIQEPVWTRWASVSGWFAFCFCALSHLTNASLPLRSSKHVGSSLITTVASTSLLLPSKPITNPTIICASLLAHSFTNE